MENKIEEDSSDSGRFSRSSTGDSNLPVDNFILEIDDDTKTNDSSFTHDEETSLENISVEQDESHVDDQQPKSKTPSINKKKDMRGGRHKQTVISEEEQKAEEERIYKRLMHLLNTSKFFTSHLLKKMESSDLKQEKKSKNIKPATSSSTGEKESTTTTAGRSSRRVLTENVTNQTNARTKRPSPDDAEMKENAPKRRKKKIDIAISDVLTKEAVEEAHRQHMEKETDAETKENEVEDSGSPEETKVTSLGFTVPKNQPNLLEGGALRDYQMKGLEWLKVLFENGVSGILADEMGLGKTIQVISLICHLIEMDVPGPYLIVAPLSTLSNWLQEFERFAPQVPVVLFYGNAEERYALRKKLTKPVKINDKMKSVMPVVVTSYQMPLMESQVLTGINWQFIIIDEGHRIKNKETQLNRVLTACHSHNRLLLTGTPLQNNLTELWTLLHFLLPDMFNDITTFNTWLDLNNAGKEAEKILQKEREEQMVSTLHQILFPFVLRRTKNDIALDIPPKKEVVVYCPMTDMQMELYEYVITKSLENKEIPVVDSDELPAKRKSSRSYRFYFQDKNSFDEEDDDFVYGSLRGATTKFKSPKRNEFFALKHLPKCKQWADRLKAGGKEVAFMERIKMQKPHMALLHIVNHPYLVNMPITCEKDKKYLYVSRDIIEASGKFLVLEALLAKLKQRGHKVLLFSTSCMLLDLMEEFMSMLNHTYVRLDGQCNLMDRKEDINAFNTDPNIFVFLISTRAGGLGINLTAADTVIIFNSDWNPMVDMQAQDRAHRIGQTKPVVVYRLTVAGTFDEKIVKCANNKKMMEKVVMKSDVFKLNEAPLLDLQELAALLKERKESSFVHSNPCGFSDEELDQLLDRSDLIESGKDLKVETRPANSKPSPRKSPRKVNAVEMVGEKQLKVSVEKLAI